MTVPRGDATVHFDAAPSVRRVHIAEALIYRRVAPGMEAGMGERPVPAL